MTKQEQNDIILGAFQNELQDKPIARERVGEAFSNWVQGLITQGNSELASKKAAPAPSEDKEKGTAQKGQEAVNVQAS